jgi:YbbR domain-containing protein
MKITSILIAFVLFVSCASKQVNENQILINATSLSKVGNNYEMKIAKIISDSRCPEGVTCIWAGEVQLELEIYKNQKLEKTETLSINYKTVEQNKGFFAKYISTDKKIKNILVQPIKKESQTIELKEYVLKVELE